jgi:AcrR family transcriptional regulator
MEHRLPISPAPPAAADHRTRVGQQRREKTRALLIQSALGVFAKKGPDLPVIDDFIAAAGVARGTFYNYFRTTSELLVAVAGEMSDEVLQTVDPIVRSFDDPAVRLSVGPRLYVQMALRYPIWGEFLTRVGSRHTVRGKLLDDYITRDIVLGIDSGRLRAGNPMAVRDIILGSIFYGIETLLTEPDHCDHVQDMLDTVLHGLGLEIEEAKAIARTPLPPVQILTGPIFSVLEAGHQTVRE